MLKGAQRRGLNPLTFVSESEAAKLRASLELFHTHWLRQLHRHSERRASSLAFFLQGRGWRLVEQSLFPDGLQFPTHHDVDDDERVTLHELRVRLFLFVFGSLCVGRQRDLPHLGSGLSDRRGAFRDRFSPRIFPSITSSRAVWTCITQV